MRLIKTAHAQQDKIETRTQTQTQKHSKTVNCQRVRAQASARIAGWGGRRKQAADTPVTRFVALVQ